MDKTLILITAQYTEDGKQKGTVMFSLNVNLDTLMYVEDEAISAIQRLLDKQSNEYVKYTYVDHEAIFHGITPLNDDHFEKALMSGL